MKKMHVLLWLLLPLLLLCSQAWARALPTEAGRIKHQHFNNMTKQLVTKLGTFKIPTTLTTEVVENNYTVCYMLQFLNTSYGLISGKGSQEVKSELASLSGFLDQTSHCQCKTGKAPKVLVVLQGLIRFRDSVSPTVYHLLKMYLKNLPVNSNQLENCV